MIAPPEQHKEGERGGLARGFAWWLAALSASSGRRGPARKRYKALIFKSADGLEVFAVKRKGLTTLARLAAVGRNVAAGAAVKSQDGKRRDGDRRDGESGGANSTGKGAKSKGAKSKGAKSSANKSEPFTRVRGLRRGSPALLRLGEDQVLERELQIPEAARDVLEPIITNQLEPVMPWPISEARIGYEVQGAGDGDGQLKVCTAATSNARLSEALEEAAQLGVRVEHIEFATSPQAESGIPLLAPGEAENAARRARSIRNSLVLFLIIALAIAGLGLWRWLPAYRAHRAIAAELAALQARVAEVREANSRRAERIAQRRRLVELRKRRPAVVVVLAALTRALPDDAYLTRLELRGERLLITGTARDAASLVERLEAMPLFADVAFSAPTIREKGKPGERFTISARLLGEVDT